LVKARSKNS